MAVTRSTTSCSGRPRGRGRPSTRTLAGMSAKSPSTLARPSARSISSSSEDMEETSWVFGGAEKGLLPSRCELAHDPEFPRVLDDRVVREADSVLRRFRRLLPADVRLEQREQDRVPGDEDGSPAVLLRNLHEGADDPVRRVVQGFPLVVLVVEVRPAPAFPFLVRLLRHILLRRRPLPEILHRADRLAKDGGADARGLHGPREAAAVDHLRRRMRPR